MESFSVDSPDRKFAAQSVVNTPELQLRTLFVLDGARRIVGTREAVPGLGPLFSLIRDRDSCAWAVRADVDRDVADELDGLAGNEPPVTDLRQVPVYAERYKSLLEGRVDSGPSFAFPETITRPAGVVVIEDIDVLSRHFSGWAASEIPGCAPIVGVLEGGYAVSVCFSARRSDEAAEAGVETAVDWRGRGLAPRVTAAWASAVRGSGRIPLYSTSWSNEASLAVARKLGLVGFGCVRSVWWSVWAP